MVSDTAGWRPEPPARVRAARRAWQTKASNGLCPGAPEGRSPANADSDLRNLKASCCFRALRS